MPKIALKDHTEMKLQLIHAVIAGRVISYSAGPPLIGQVQVFTIQVEYSPTIMRKLNELEAKRHVAAARKRKKAQAKQE